MSISLRLLAANIIFHSSKDVVVLAKERFNFSKQSNSADFANRATRGKGSRRKSFKIPPLHVDHSRFSMFLMEKKKLNRALRNSYATIFQYQTKIAWKKKRKITHTAINNYITWIPTLKEIYLSRNSRSTCRSLNNYCSHAIAVIIITIIIIIIVVVVIVTRLI